MVEKVICKQGTVDETIFPNTEKVDLWYQKMKFTHNAQQT